MILHSGQLGVAQRASGAPYAERGRSLARAGLLPTVPTFASHGPVTSLSCGKAQVEDIPPTRAKAP